MFERSPVELFAASECNRVIQTGLPGERIPTQDRFEQDEYGKNDEQKIRRRHEFTQTKSQHDNRKCQHAIKLDK